MPIPIFNEELHKYTTPAGEVLPGVTSILGEYIKVERLNVAVHTVTGLTIPLSVLRAAAEYGTAVHKIFELSVLHGVGSFDYPEQMDLPVRQIAAFIKDCQPTVIMCEQPLYSEKKKYAGTPDLFCTMKGKKRICCIDVKTGEGVLTGPQTAAYAEELFREETGEKGLIDRYKLRLPKSGGDYKLVPLKNHNDLMFFHYKLWCRNFANNL